MQDIVVKVIPTIFFDPKSFEHKNFLGPKIILDLKTFWDPKFRWTPNFVGPQNFVGPNKILDQKFLSEPTFFC